MDDNTSLLCLPKDLISCIAQDFNSLDMQNVMKTCKLYSIHLKILYKLSLKVELKNSVFKAKPFSPLEFSKHDQETEMKLYKPLMINNVYRYDISLKNTLIGYAIYKVLDNYKPFWCGYCILPKFIDFHDTFQFIHQELKTLNITILYNNALTISWNYQFYYEYKNLSHIIADIWFVWSRIHQYPQIE